MDSSPDLSLKLRRGSSDSRDSFYLNLAQGVDSDIEEVTARPQTTKDQKQSSETDDLPPPPVEPTSISSIPSSTSSSSPPPPPLHLSSPPPIHRSSITSQQSQGTISSPKQISSPIQSGSPHSQQSASPPSQRGSIASQKSIHSKSPPSQRGSISSQRSLQYAAPQSQQISSPPQRESPPSLSNTRSPPSKRGSISSQRSQPQSPPSQRGSISSQRSADRQSVKSPSAKRPSITSQRSVGSIHSQHSQHSSHHSPPSHQSQHSHHSQQSQHSIPLSHHSQATDNSYSPHNGRDINSPPIRRGSPPTESPPQGQMGYSPPPPLQSASPPRSLHEISESPVLPPLSPPLPASAFEMQRASPPDSPPIELASPPNANGNEGSEDDTTIDMTIPVDVPPSSPPPLPPTSASDATTPPSSVLPAPSSVDSTPLPTHRTSGYGLGDRQFTIPPPPPEEIDIQQEQLEEEEEIEEEEEEEEEEANLESTSPPIEPSETTEIQRELEKTEEEQQHESEEDDEIVGLPLPTIVTTIAPVLVDEGDDGDESDDERDEGDDADEEDDNGSNEQAEDNDIQRRLDQIHIEEGERVNADSDFIAVPMPPPTPLSIDDRSASENNGSETSYELDDLSDQINQILEKDPIEGTGVAADFNIHNIDWLKNYSNSNSPARQGSTVMEVPPHHPSPISPASSTHHQLVTITTTTTQRDGNGGGSGGGSSPPPSGGGGGPGATSSSTQQLVATASGQGGHLALMYHSSQHHPLPMLPTIRKSSRAPSYYSTASHHHPEIKAGDALATTFSALYGKLLVVMGIAFPMAEVISTYIPPSFYEVYYLYLYVGSMLFLLFMYATLLWGRPKIVTPKKSPKKKASATNSSASDSMEESDTESCSSEEKRRQAAAKRRPSLLAPIGGKHYHYGSFYLRMGAVAFGIGSMIYSGLEFGQYFELERDTKCHNVLLALTPATRMAFIFIQMYFIFLNNEQIKVYRHKIIARFGLMHMIGTNLSVWLNVLIQETKHEILTFYDPENRTLRISHRLGNRMQHFDHSAHLRVARGLKGPYQIFECRRTNIIGTLVQDASPFLFPCTIEYSLICAAILYVMWRSISHPSSTPPVRIENQQSPIKRSPHHYSVDCARAHKGLFVGILILVLTIISLILFFVLISRPEFVSLAVTEVTICELTIYATATIATVIGMIQIRVLQYDAYRCFTLDDILLVGAQSGLFLYSTFTVIGGHFTLRKDTILVLITALASIVQTAFQTMFILDASRRQAVSPEHMRRKPGREIVTFMLVANLAMWAISTLEKSRAESHPIQLNFYGLWAWTIITHVSMPLAIFYRFHSTVCLCEIWKRAYKLKPTYM
ncbi:proton channel OtopLc isoform X2 [Condylostylus longicornis]|uniref:proton channel OtopLc isoform X2 n=1 Tax=Condylostylus longicornis TaxID=2530218 RepID=UPI00244E5790|nr:proton channel OtopLc isoform X2 [Condylostylus longicornis]